MRKWVSRRVERRSFDVAIGTDLRNRSLACEELLAMTTQTRRVFRKVGDIFANAFVTRNTREFFFSDVSRVRKDTDDHEYQYFQHDLFFAAEVEAQRRVRQVRVIILRPWSNYRAFVVVVILVANVPIEPVVHLDR